MRGILTEASKKLALEVGEGNPGAFRVIDELLWFTEWFKMMEWCRDNNLKGANLWMKYKDEFHQDSHALGIWIESQMFGKRKKVRE